MGTKSLLLVSFMLLATSLIYPGPHSGQPKQPLSTPEDSFKNTIQQVYESLNDHSLNSEAFHLAMLGYRSLSLKGLVLKDSLLTVIDYSRPSSDDRFFVINILKRKVVYKSLVAHGCNSGELYASRFSNRAQSHQTALGFYITGNPYKGGQGYSMLLNGVDTGYNDQARLRSIVIHGASYATRSYIDRYGRLGRSFGCPALPPDKTAVIIDLIKNGSVLFSYFPSTEYLNRSRILGSLSKVSLLSASNL